ncbi:hypothetical protein [Brassicibacter mesophilus]|uniref:hypothetical protein n=1 Tax=Brassicibacter mesophilus TaxID=745119 RepID=UPI003D1D157E
MKDKKIYCKYTSEIVCPYCGHKFLDSWEYDDSDNEMYCEECEHEFTYERIVTVEYCSYKND